MRSSGPGLPRSLWAGLPTKLLRLLRRLLRLRARLFNHEACPILMTLDLFTALG